MKIKKHQLFLWISLAFLVAGCVLSLIEIITEYIEYGIHQEDDLFGFGFEVIIYLFCTIPVFLLATSFIVSVYKLLKYTPHGAILICWLIAALLSASAIVFQILTLYGVLDFVGDSGSIKVQGTLLMLTSWPVIIVSFVLSSIHKRRSKNEAQIKGTDNP